ncbi:hypothetical protein CEUSTIGMA_g7828.t1 [Chlamydomonas eustigma]|uniref:Methyltransferase-like protein n=1 Tax=Chlamydomonas eustigma TaxID=1157962 RepID=A0A250XBV7_9CHLO|nr:hypothetical protein CEUSTIGMA_g7828.t1 [Chlamydomonas eustigma]|eukprot:GAX80389.1 hypothetical protein CEUSTIGMA_g7828.t1 [Chlamydomonas eustigma]
MLPVCRPRLLTCKTRHFYPLCTAQKTSYVGQRVPLASEYHENDFEWEEHALIAAPLVREQEEKAAVLRNKGLDVHKVAPGMSPDIQQVQLPAFSPEMNTATGQRCEGGHWEAFYQQHTEARFYKLRRYILLEFPALSQLSEEDHVMEIGCGCGSSILPVLAANRSVTATVTDVSTTSTEQLVHAACCMGILPPDVLVPGAATPKIKSFICDSSDPEAAPHFNDIHASHLLIMFTLSAIPPPKQLEMLKNAFRALRPGGKLLLRDHGLYDMVQLRIPAEQWLAPNLYRRGDSTLAYFFSLEDFKERAEAAGFTVEECKYVCVINKNKKTGIELKRVFMHAVCRK